MAEHTGGPQAGVGIEGQSGSGGGENNATPPRNPDAAASDRNGQGHQTYEQAKRTAADGYAHARQTISDLGGQAQRAASDWTRSTRADTEAYVRENPWNALGIAAGIAFLVGLMLRR